MSTCPGSGQRWRSQWGAIPYCPVCRRGPKALKVTAPARRKGKFVGAVPTHEETIR